MKSERMKKTWLSGLLVTLLCLWSLPVLAGVAKPVPTGPWDAALNAPAVPDYFTTANWAYSPPLTKFVDKLPGLGAANANGIGQYLPVATPDITKYPGSDYYEIELVEYTEKLHSDLTNGTRLRGYRQTNKGTNTTNCGAAPKVACTSANTTVVPPTLPHYLGPIIVSTKDRPVRIKFTNNLPATTAGGNLFIPVDKTFMGAGPGPAKSNGVRGGSTGVSCASDALPTATSDNPSGCAEYAENRATIHLHGGKTPWISDGTAHQWITPANEITPWPKGVSVKDVPDMPLSDPLDGSQTFFYTNQQSARLLFYHDHAFGITRLNVYVGEAAGYLITDKWEQDLVSRGILPPDQIPLVIEDKTFVDASTLTYTDAIGNTVNTGIPTVRFTDPLWNWGTGAVGANGVRTPVTGDLWFPHVYMPNQNPYAISGTNSFGRWFYGPWFYPPTVITRNPVANPYFDVACADPTLPAYAGCTTPGQPPLIPGTPHPSSGMEAFMDTAMVNGTPFPVLEVDPRAYRFRVLNASNDRGLNLSLYKADTTVVAAAGPNAARLDDHTEVKMVPAATPLNGDVWPPLWPVDGRLGGVPDPGNCTLTAGSWSCPNWGPKMIQIGTEAGFLPKAVVRDPQPVTYVTNPAAFWVGVVQDTGLALMPAERADVVVDFKGYEGQTLILYNDGPTAWPALDPRYDFFSGAPDMRDTGGYGIGGIYDALTKSWTGGTGPRVGFGPNTRTIMQIKVRGSVVNPPVTPLNVPFNFVKANLDLEFTNAAPATTLNPVLAANPVGVSQVTTVSQIGKTLPLFQRAQEPIIALQADYQNAYPYYLIPGATTQWGGIRHSMLEHGLNFITSNGKKAVTPLQPKAMHDEMGASFDKIYGRMQSNLGMQIPIPTTNNANMIIYGYQDKPSEIITNSLSLPTGVQVSGVQITATLLNNLSDGTQIWNISHNGVDTHPIHFHIFDVQLINRMGWDGMLALPDPNELGWKDTIRISPLMDTIVALRPIAPLLPFGIPDSNRPLAPALPIGSAMGFKQVDWLTNAAFNPPVSNILTSFGWEYVWHCHILSHEEMDMMRPIVLTVTTAAPNAPTGLTVSTAGVLNWTDPTPVLSSSTQASQQKNEIGFKIYRCNNTSANCPVVGATAALPVGTNFTQIGTALANATSYIDTTATAGTRTYRVVAWNQSGSTTSTTNVTATFTAGTLTKPTVSIATSPVTNPVTTTYAYGANITIAATVTGAPTRVEYYINGALYKTATTTPFSMSITNASPGTLVVTAKAVKAASAAVAGLESVVSNTLTLTVGGVTEAPASITVPVGSANGSYTVSWAASATANATYQLQESTTAAFTAPTTTTVVTGTSATSFAITGKTSGVTYYYRVKAQHAPDADSTWTTGANGCKVVTIAAPSWILVPAASTNGIYSVYWGASTTAGATYILEESTDGFSTVAASYPTTLLVMEFSGKATNNYSYRVRAALPAAVANVPSIPSVAKGIVVTIAPLEQRTVTIPGFSQPLLTGAAQSPWENELPNALAGYFTYVPYTTTDAVNLGFPASCGNLAKGDSTSTEDCYTITVQNGPQGMSLPSAWGFGGPGLLDNMFAPANPTFFFGYGSGGTGWLPPGAAVPVTGNAPAVFVDGTLGTQGIWHFPAPTIKGTNGRPVRVQWLNELSNTEPTGLDPSVDCGPVALNCFPYNRTVVHVHGAHVGPESDGLASAWYTPGFALVGEDWKPSTHGPEGTYYYPMDQEASTIWYHDHAMGTTHNNTNMGMAGFFPITDANEKALIAAKKLPTGDYELGFALQDRHFTTAGQMAMPDYPTYDRTTPGCVIDAVTGLPHPDTCTLVKWMKDPLDGHKIPYDNVTVAGKAILADPINANAPFGATSATLEYFGNMPVVNGATYGKYNIEPRIYRMRFIGGTDSRTWVMQLQRTDMPATVQVANPAFISTQPAGPANPATIPALNPASIIPIHVIGSEQGLLNAPVARNELDLMPGERVDVLVDFTAIPMGTRVIMNNLGGDSPWAGYEDYKLQIAAGTWARSTDIPEIMAFDVVQPLSAVANTTAPGAIGALRTAITPLTTPNKVRVVSLMEITDGYGRTMPTIDARGFKPIGIPITEIIKLNDVEQWDIVNTTVDAHPMHLHQVAFQVIDRQALVVDPAGVVTSFTPPVDDIINQVFTPPSYTVAPGSAAIAPDAWDAGWKDTVASPPGYVTRVIAKFDIVGDYVWHCHILSHEEHDMMRPFVVTDANNTAPAPFSITVPASSLTGSYTIEWVGTAITGVSYTLQESLNGGTFATIYSGVAPRFDVIDRAAGTYTYQVNATPPTGSVFTASAYTAGKNGTLVALTAITSPVAGAIVTQGTPITIVATAPATALRVDFYDNGASLGAGTFDSATNTYSKSWTPATQGAHNLTARAYFSLSSSSESTGVTVTAVGSIVPGISINTPVSGAVFAFGAAIPIQSTPVATPGVRVILVEYFADGGTTPIGYSFAAPYSYSWANATAGAHSLTAVAYYSNGDQPTSVALPINVVIAPVAPTSLFAAGIETPATQTYSWSAVANATSYMLYVDYDNSYNVFTAAAAGCASGTGTCTVSLNKPIPAGTQVISLVLATNISVNSGWSSAFFFNIMAGGGSLPAAPGAITASGTDTPTTTQTYSWSAVANAASYTVYVDFDNSFNTFASTALGCGAGTGTCTVTMNKAIPAGARVITLAYSSNFLGNSGWSPTTFYNIAGAVSIPPPPGTITASGTAAPAVQTYSWAAISTATSYTIYVDFDNSYNTFSSTALGCGAGTGTCTATMNKPIPAGASVITLGFSMNIAGNSGWSPATFYNIQ